MENKVKFKIGEIEFEAEGSAEVIEREREIFMNALLPATVDAIVRTRGGNVRNQYIETEPSLVMIGETPAISATALQYNQAEDIDWQRTSLSSYVGKFGKVNDRDFVLISAYYYEKKNGIKSFSIESVKQYYNEARRNKYSNPSQLLTDLAKKGLIMDDPDNGRKSPKYYIISSEGIEYIKSYRPQEQDEKKSTKIKKSRVKVKSKYEGINIDELNLSKYPEIKKLHDFKEKMMMVMFIVTNEKAGEWFSVTDIMYLMTDIFGEAATVDQINGVFKREKLWFNKSEQTENNKREMKRKLLNQGMDFARSLLERRE